MEFTSAQILPALDAYMKENGGGTKYIATRLQHIFDNKTAPFNTKTGALASLAKSSSTFAKKLDSISEKLVTKSTEMLEVFKKTKTSLITFNDKINALSLDIKKFKLPSVNIPDNNISNTVKPKSPSNENNPVVEKQNYTTMLQSFAKVLTEKPIPITISSINSKVLNEIKLNSRKEELLNKSGLSRQRPTNNIINNRTITSNSNINTDPESEKSGIFGTILKWGALIGGAIFAAPYLEKLLDSTTIGIKLKEFIGSIFTTLGKWTDKLFKGGENSLFAKSIYSFVNLISRAGSFIFTSVFDTLERNKEDIYKGLSTIGKVIMDKLIKPTFSWLGEKIMKGEFLGLSGVYLLARFTPVLGSLIKLIEKPLLKGATSLGSKLFDLFKSAPLTNSITRSTSILGRLGGFLGRLGVIGGIITTGSIAIERLWTLGKNIKKAMDEKDGVFGLDDMRDTEKTNASSLAKNRLKTEDKVKDWQKIRETRELTAIEKLMEAKDIQTMKIKALNDKLGLISKNEDLTYTTLAVGGGMGSIPVRIPNDKRPQNERSAAVMKDIEAERKRAALIEADIQKLSKPPIAPSNNIKTEQRKPLMLDDKSLQNDKIDKQILFEMLEDVRTLLSVNIEATVQSGQQVAGTVVATAGANSSSTPKSYGNSDPVRDQRNRANIANTTMSRHMYV